MTYSLREWPFQRRIDQSVNYPIVEVLIFRLVGSRVVQCLQRTCLDSVAVLETFWNAEHMTPEMVASVLRPKVCKRREY